MRQCMWLMGPFSLHKQQSNQESCFLYLEFPVRMDIWSCFYLFFSFFFFSEWVILIWSYYLWNIYTINTEASWTGPNKLFYMLLVVAWDYSILTLFYPLSSSGVPTFLKTCRNVLNVTDCMVTNSLLSFQFIPIWYKKNWISSQQHFILSICVHMMNLIWMHL